MVPLKETLLYNPIEPRQGNPALEPYSTPLRAALLTGSFGPLTSGPRHSVAPKGFRTLNLEHGQGGFLVSGT